MYTTAVGLVWGSAATSALSLHSSNEPGELSQWLSHDDSTINIILIIIVVVIIIIIMSIVCISEAIKSVSQLVL